jgi:hypothetical protein
MIINQPALIAAALMACLCISLAIVDNLEALGLGAASLRVLFFCCVALACLVGVVVCILTNGGGIL